MRDIFLNIILRIVIRMFLKFLRQLKLFCLSKFTFKYIFTDMYYAMQHYVIKFATELRQVDGFCPGIPVSFTNKTDRYYITRILPKVALNTITCTCCTVCIYKQAIVYTCISKIFIILAIKKSQIKLEFKII